jgi:phenylacetate-CoA ligase
MTVLPVGNHDAARKVEHIECFKPKALYGGSSYFAHIASLMDGRAKTSSIEILLTGMEGVGLPFLKNLEEQWGAKAAERFGCAQMRADFMFTDENGVGDIGKPGVLYNMDPYVLLEVLDPSTGQPVRDGEFGELVVGSPRRPRRPGSRRWPKSATGTSPRHRPAASSVAGVAPSRRPRW